MKVTTMKLKMFVACALLLMVISGCGAADDGPPEPMSNEVLEQVKQEDAAVAADEGAM